jgi:acid phosphatase (class A)
MKLLIVLLCAATGTLLAQATKPKTPFFISADQLNAASILVNPPAAESWQNREEMAELLRLQQTRTGADIERAKADDAEEDMFIFRGVLGVTFDRNKLPLTALLSDHLHSDESVIVNPAKNAFRRVRPYFFDASVKPVCKVKSDQADYAYPSGHATSGYLEAFALAMMIPEKRDQILTRADEYAHNRLVCGVHYASDIAAGKDTAYAMFALMLQNPRFQQEFVSAKAETRRALGL